MEEVEARWYWLELFLDDENHQWNDFDEFGAWGIDWWDYPGSGSVNSMNEYYQMHLLTLLRKLDVGTAKRKVKDRGW